MFTAAIRKVPASRRVITTSISMVKTKKSILVLAGVATAVILLAPAEEFDDLDCQNHVNFYDDPLHPDTASTIH
jgi:hypothetical protein